MCLDMSKWERMAGTHARNRRTGPGRFAGKISVVTGAAGGYGRGVAEELYREGAYVVIADRNLDQAETLAGILGERAIGISVDVTDEKSVAGLVAKTVEYFGGLDLMVANSGEDLAGREAGSGKAVSGENRTDRKGVLLCCRYAAKIMRAQNRTNPFVMYDIVAMASRPALEDDGNLTDSPYGGIGVVERMALELFSNNIKVNAICPQSRSVPKEAESGVRDSRQERPRAPREPECGPADMAQAVVRCVEQRYETGQAFPVEGARIA